MAGLVPAIHVFLAARKTWMPATSAGMTVEIACSVSGSCAGENQLAGPTINPPAPDTPVRLSPAGTCSASVLASAPSTPRPGPRAGRPTSWCRSRQARRIHRPSPPCGRCRAWCGLRRPSLHQRQLEADEALKLALGRAARMRIDLGLSLLAEIVHLHFGERGAVDRLLAALLDEGA